MKPLDVEVAGIGAWCAGRAGWPAFVAGIDHAPDAWATSARPSAALLPPAERRRAPDGVAVALEVAREAQAMAAGRIGSTPLASVFASAHGDLAIVDYLCATLATDAASLSPTKFHLSVHNAAAGNWAIATRDRAPTSATAAGDDTFALGLLDAATQAIAERRPVLLVVFDTAAVGLLAHAVDGTALFGFALVLRPVAGPGASGLALDVERGRSAPPSPRREWLRGVAASSAAARATALAEALADRDAATLRYPVGGDTTLSVRIRAPIID